MLSLPETILSLPPQVTRFAPSPTGRLHLGHAYSAYFVLSCARATGGSYLLRLEDTDHTRCRAPFYDAIRDDLAFLGLSPDRETPAQSTRMGAYQAALSQLQDSGLLYPCFCTRKDIARSVTAPHGPDGNFYPGTCRHLSDDERQARMAAQPYALRLDTKTAAARAGPLAFQELMHKPGSHTVDYNAIDDVVLARKDIGTSYNLAVVVDDAADGVTLVTRGQDIFAATGLHRLLQALLDLPAPRYAHHPLVVDDQGRRLAKRADDVALGTLRDAGWSAAQIMAEALGRLLQDGAKSP